MNENLTAVQAYIENNKCEVNATGSEARHIIELLVAESQGRLSEVFAMENKLCSACLDAWRHEKALMVSALEKAAEEIENCHNRETPLTEEIRDVLRQVLTE